MHDADPRSPRPRPRAALAWSLWAVALVFTALNVVFLGLTSSTPAPAGLGSRAAEVLAGLGYLATTYIGALIATRRPQNPIGWTLVAAGVVLAMAAFAGQYGAYAVLTEPGRLPAGRVEASLGACAWLAATG